MKSAVSFTLILSLVGSALPVRAEEKTRVLPATASAPSAHSLEPSLSVGRPLRGIEVSWFDVRDATVAVAVDQGNERLRQVSARASRSGRAVAKGALIGFALGATLGMTVGQEACLNQPRWHCAKVGVPFAAIGALIGWLHK